MTFGLSTDQLLLGCQSACLVAGIVVATILPHPGDDALLVSVGEPSLVPVFEWADENDAAVKNILQSADDKKAVIAVVPSYSSILSAFSHGFVPVAASSPLCGTFRNKGLIQT